VGVGVGVQVRTVGLVHSAVHPRTAQYKHTHCVCTGHGDGQANSLHREQARARASTNVACTKHSTRRRPERAAHPLCLVCSFSFLSSPCVRSVLSTTQQPSDSVYVPACFSRLGSEAPLPLPCAALLLALHAQVKRTAPPPDGRRCCQDDAARAPVT
jgi:hypothetical protein